MIVVRIDRIEGGVGQSVGPFPSVEAATTWVEAQLNGGLHLDRPTDIHLDGQTITVKVRIIESPEAEDSAGLVAP